MTHDEVMTALKEPNYREQVKLIDPPEGWERYKGATYRIALYVPEIDVPFCNFSKLAFDYHGVPENGIVLDPRGHPEMAFPYIWSLDRFEYVPQS